MKKSKRILICLSLLFLMFSSCRKVSCTNGIKDGNEIGVDCGGDCVPCTICEVQPEIIVKDTLLYGVWYPIYRRTSQFNTVNGDIYHCQVVTDSIDCKINFKQNWLTQLAGFKVSEGVVNSCAFPSEFGWDYIPETNLLDVSNDAYNYDVTVLTSDSLSLDRQFVYPQEFVFSKTGNSYIGETPSMILEFETDMALPENSVKFNMGAFGIDTLLPGELYWSQQVSAANIGSTFQFDVIRMSNMPVGNSDFNFRARIRDADGHVILETIATNEIESRLELEVFW